MATYYDGLNYIYKLFEAEPPAASTQLLLLHLLHENNRHGNTGTIQISDRELGHRTSLSKQTITEAKRTLKNRGLIDFKTDHRKPRLPTTYTLTFFNGLGQKVGQSVGQKVDQRVGQKVGQNALVSYTLNQAKKDERGQSAEAGARTGHEGERVAKASEFATPKIPENPEMDIHEVWEYETGYKLTGSLAYELETLANENFELVRNAIIAGVAKKATARLRYKLFKELYNEMKSEGKAKEGERAKGERSLAEELRYLEEISGER